MFKLYKSTLLLVLSFLLLSSAPGLAIDTTPLDLIHAQGCKGCHVLNNSGGILGPDLNDIGNRFNRKQILQKLIRHKTTEPSSTMPDFRHMTEQELLLMADYLSLQR